MATIPKVSRQTREAMGMTVHYPPQPNVRAATVAEINGGLALAAAEALRQHPFARPVGNMTMSTMQVVVEPVEYPEHPYRPSMIWPPNAPRELCMVCRGTHEAEFTEQ